MNRGGSRWSIAIGALFGLSMLLPAAVHASTPLTITLAASTTSAFLDQSFTLTATISPAVPGLQIDFNASSGLSSPTAMTDGSGVASVTIQGAAQHLQAGSYDVYASFAFDGTYADATSNTVEIELSRRSNSESVTYATNSGGSVIYPVDGVVLNARITAPTCDGTFDFFEVQDGLQIGSSYEGPGTIVTTEDGVPICGLEDPYVGHLSVGTHEFEVDYRNSPTADDATTLVDVPVEIIPTVLTMTADPNPVEPGSITDLTASLSAPTNYGYSLEFSQVSFFEGTTLLGSTTVVERGADAYQAILGVSYRAVGTHFVHAVFSGTVLYAPATSPTVTLSMIPNAVHVSDIKLSASTFYPVVDGYVDSVLIEGNLEETASVAITITNASSGAVVRRLAVPTRSSGLYRVSWDGHYGSNAPSAASLLGRSSAIGGMVPAGTYRVTQVITDDVGAHLTFANNVVVSLKRLYWSTGSAILDGNRTTAKGGDGATFTSSPTYSGGERVTMEPMPWLYGALGYQFTLPSATVYSSLSFSVLGSGTGSPSIAMQDPRLGTWAAGKAWIINFFAPSVDVPTKYGWTTVVGNPTYNRIGRTVRGLVLATGWNGGHYDVSKVKLTYRYALLK